MFSDFRFFRFRELEGGRGARLGLGRRTGIMDELHTTARRRGGKMDLAERMEDGDME